MEDKILIVDHTIEEITVEEFTGASTSTIITTTHGMDKGDQHTIRDIVGLTTKLHDIEKLHQVRSNLGGHADYYEWGEEATEDNPLGPGYFVRLGEDGMIHKCTNETVVLRPTDLPLNKDENGEVIIYALAGNIPKTAADINKYYVVGTEVPYDIYGYDGVEYVKKSAYSYDGEQVIRTCHTTDMLGVTVSSAGFVGNDENITGTYTSAKAADPSRYALVATTGVVDVLCDHSILVGDYVFPTVSGWAAKSTGSYGYLVTALVQNGIAVQTVNKDELLYARIVLSQSMVNAKKISDNVDYLLAETQRIGENVVKAVSDAQTALDEVRDNSNSLSDRVNNFESSMGAMGEQLYTNTMAVNTANTTAMQAEEIARQAETYVQEVASSATDGASEALAIVKTLEGEIQALSGDMDEYSSTIKTIEDTQSAQSTMISKAESDIAAVQTKATSLENSVTTLANKNTELANTMSLIDQKANEQGASITALTSKIDKYSVGEYSQAYGLTQAQAADILEAGKIVFIPTNFVSSDASFIERYNPIALESWRDTDKNTKYIYKVEGNYYYYNGTSWTSDTISNMQSHGYCVTNFEEHYSYVWNGLKWVPETAAINVFFTDDPRAEMASPSPLYWVVGSGHCISKTATEWSALITKDTKKEYYITDTKKYYYYNGATWTEATKPQYKIGGLYLAVYNSTLQIWEWKECALGSSNSMSRVSALVEQTQNSWQASISNVKGDMAALSSRVDENGSNVAMVASVVKEVTGVNLDFADNTEKTPYASKDNIVSTDQTKYFVVGTKAPYDLYYYNGTTYVQKINWSYDGQRVLQPNTASIVTSANEDTSGIKLSADHITFEGTTYKVDAKYIDFTGDEYKINADRIELAGSTTFSNYATSNNVISSQIVEYTKSTSNIRLEDGAVWTQSYPTRNNSEYIWRRTTVIKGDGTAIPLSPECVTSLDGNDGTSVSIIGTADSVSNIGTNIYTVKFNGQDVTNGKLGDCYICDGYLYTCVKVFTGSDHFSCVGMIQGNPGAGLEVKYKQIEKTDSFTLPTAPTTATALSEWDSDMPDERDGYVIYMIQKISTSTTWSNPIQISGIEGKVGADGESIKFVYCLSVGTQEVALPTPTFTNGELSTEGWTESPSGVTEQRWYEYVSTSTTYDLIDGKKNWKNFTTPVIWSKWGERGQNGDGVEYLYYLSNTKDAPTVTTKYGDAIPTGWKDEPSGTTSEKPYEYVIQIKSIDTSSKTYTGKLWAVYDGLLSLYAVSTNTPNTPTGVGSVASSSEHTTWEYEVPSVLTQDGVVWTSFKTFLGEHWSAPVMISAKHGKDGTSVHIIGTATAKTYVSDDYYLLEYDGAQISGAGLGDGYMFEGDLYVCTKVNDGVDYFTNVGRIEGPQGAQGVQGPIGPEGKTSFFHVKYSAKANPTTAADISDTPDEYIGTYVDYELNDSTDPSKYTWAKFRGDPGAQGLPGEDGENGLTSYLHIAYANSIDGTIGFTVDLPEGESRAYIGQYVDFTEDDSSNPTSYKWSRIAGAEGASLIIKYKNDTSTPLTPTDLDAVGWDNVVPTVESGKKTYMIQRMSNVSTWSNPLQITATDGATPTVEIVNIDGKNVWQINGENTNIIAEGSNGLNGTTPNIGANGNWWLGSADTGVRAEGPAGKDGSNIEYVYQRTQEETNFSSSMPGYAADNTTLINGWYDSPRGIGYDNEILYKYEYMSMRTKPVGGEWGSFTDPVIWARWGDKGTDGDGVEYKFCVMTEKTTPEYPAPDTAPYTWKDDPSGVNDTDRYEYVIKLTTNGETKVVTPSNVSLWNQYDKITALYAKSTERPTEPAGIGSEASASENTTWGVDIPIDLSATQSVWVSYSTISDGTWTSPIKISALDGANGKGIKSVETYYLVTTTNTPPTETGTGKGKWNTSIENWGAKDGDNIYQYLWIREAMTMDDNTVIWTNPRLDASMTTIGNWCAESDKTLINGGNIATGTVTAAQMAADAIKSHNYDGKVDANGNITTYGTVGTMLNLQDGVFDSNNVRITGCVTATSGNIGGCEIVGGQLTASQLSSLSANLGEIKAGSIESENYKDRTPIVWGEEELVPSEGLSYSLSSDGTYYTVTGIGSCTDNDLVIPEVYNDLPVTTLNDTGWAWGLNLTSVFIPESITTITSGAFSTCSKLQNIIIAKNNTTYQSIDGNIYRNSGATLFRYAPGKTNQTFIIPDSVTSIGDEAFRNCSSLTSVEIPDSVTSIGFEAFYRCSSLTSAVIHNGVTSIGSWAFAHCSLLENVIIPQSVRSIGLYAFEGCSGSLKFYYKGTQSQWDEVEITAYDSGKAIKYYYSETEPTGEGNYWHYKDAEGFKIACDDEYMIRSPYFKVTQDGEIEANAGKIGGWELHRYNTEGDVSTVLSNKYLTIQTMEDGGNSNNQASSIQLQGYYSTRVVLSCDDESIEFYIGKEYTGEQEIITFLKWLIPEVTLDNGTYSSSDLDLLTTPVYYNNVRHTYGVLYYNEDIQWYELAFTPSQDYNHGSVFYTVYPGKGEISIFNDSLLQTNTTLRDNEIQTPRIIAKLGDITNISVETMTGSSGGLILNAHTSSNSGTKVYVNLVTEYDSTSQTWWPKLAFYRDSTYKTPYTLTETHTINIGYSYWANTTGNINEVRSITVPSGVSQYDCKEYISVSAWGGIYDVRDVSFWLSMFPQVVTEGEVLGTRYIGIDTNFMPVDNGQHVLGGENNKWKDVYSKNAACNTSDRNEKNSIEQLPAQYDTFFDALQPVRYKFNQNESNRYHVGFIAQDVHEALNTANIPTSDFAGYIAYDKTDGTTGYGLRYGEFIALNTYEIQKLKKEVSELKNELAKLKSQQNDYSDE